MTDGLGRLGRVRSFRTRLVQVASLSFLLTPVSLHLLDLLRLVAVLRRSTSLQLLSGANYLHGNGAQFVVARRGFPQVVVRTFACSSPAPQWRHLLRTTSAPMEGKTRSGSQARGRVQTRRLLVHVGGQDPLFPQQVSSFLNLFATSQFLWLTISPSALSPSPSPCPFVVSLSTPPSLRLPSTANRSSSDPPCGGSAIFVETGQHLMGDRVSSEGRRGIRGSGSSFDGSVVSFKALLSPHPLLLPSRSPSQIPPAI